MIIELFGPPGVGKTTFACALAARLRAQPPRESRAELSAVRGPADLLC